VVSHRVLIGLSGLLLTLCGFVIVPAIWDRLHTLYATPETESAFFKSYTPKLAIEAFEENLPTSEMKTRSSAAGTEFVTHTDGFDWYFAMRSEKWIPFINALRDDALAQLVGNGAKILDQSGDPRDGFQIDYKLGKSVGSLTISPLAITSPPVVHPSPPLPEGTVRVTAAIRVSEKWFPKEPGTLQISVMNFTY
jgi:hypothetical protein